ncbi:Putative deoxycytidylate deaminase [Glycine soja]|uniref:dCMP deaminase n=1 Tax=Glycine soja TaxID=3848 RepID=A0A0B2PY85_GLYSO|nr:Putative deoxycytidylate deaminase [Glycine soja]
MNNCDWRLGFRNRFSLLLPFPTARQILAKRHRFLSPRPCRLLQTQRVGACLVSQDGVILGIGYNGFPRGCSDDKLPWAQKSRTGNPLKTKYPCNLVDGFFFLLVYFCYVCHAEVNAILNTNHASAAGQRLYVTMFPCNECAKIIIQVGVSEVIYFVEKRLFRKHQPMMNEIHLKFEEH